MDFNTEKKGLFLTLSTITLLLMMVLTTLLWWFVSPRLHEINTILANLSLTALRVFYFILLLSIVLIYFISYAGKKNILAKFTMQTYTKILYPITFFFGDIIGIDKDKMRESFTHLNNAFIKAIKKKYKPNNLLILLPHCLQNTECKIRVTVNIQNCLECGKCSIGDLFNLAKKYKVAMRIATGGTLARRIIVENKPKFIIAVACGRDMVEGLREVFPIPVYGVLNEQPEGPCINTNVAVNLIEEALSELLLDE